MKSFMDSDAEGFTGLKRGDAFYRPMTEVVNLLKTYDFTIYIVTATERNIVRAIVRDTIGHSASVCDRDRVWLHCHRTGGY